MILRSLVLLLLLLAAPAAAQVQDTETLTVNVTIVPPQPPDSGVEVRCLELNDLNAAGKCQCAEPLNTNIGRTNRPDGTPNWDYDANLASPGYPVTRNPNQGTSIDLNDSTDDIECGSIASYGTPLKSFISTSSSVAGIDNYEMRPLSEEAAYLPPGTDVDWVLETSDENESVLMHALFSPELNEVPDTTMCWRTHQRFDEDMGLPIEPIDATAPQYKTGPGAGGNIGGLVQGPLVQFGIDRVPTSGSPFTHRILQLHVSRVWCMSQGTDNNGNACPTDMPNFDHGIVQNCMHNWCRLEYCYDYFANGRLSPRGQLEVLPSNHANSVCTPAQYAANSCHKTTYPVFGSYTGTDVAMQTGSPPKLYRAAGWAATNLNTGQIVTTSGFAQGANNRTFRVQRDLGGLNLLLFPTFVGDPAVSIVAEGAGPSVTLAGSYQSPGAFSPLKFDSHIGDMFQFFDARIDPTKNEGPHFYSHAMYAKKRGADPTFWIGTACEVLGSCQ